MTETKADGYLDQLVIKYVILNIGLEILATAPEQEKPAIFLDNMGWGQQKDYIEDTLNAHLSDNLPPLFYVFTPNDSFKYKTTNRKVENEGIRSSREGGPTFYDAVNDITNQIDAMVSAGKESLVHTLFFDKVARDKFEEALKRRLKEKSTTFQRKGSEKKEIPYSVASQQLNVPNYGVISLYNYTIKQSPQPYKSNP